jgi:hypothetical protein
VNRLVTTMWADGDPEWNRRTTLVDRRRHPGLIGFLRAFWRASVTADAVLVVGSVGFNDRYRDLLAVAGLKLRRRSRRPAAVITDATWGVGSATLARRLPGRTAGDRLVTAVVRRALPRLLDGPHVTYCVLSTDELSTLPATWGFDPRRVEFTPFSTTMWGRIDDAVTDGGYLFSGGDSLRDYGPLLDAVDGLPVAVRIATRVPLPAAPANVTAAPATADEFDSLLLGARLVVVPLQSTVRSSGQQTYLNAMALGKPVIVTDAPGVRDYIEDNVSGLVVKPDAAALRGAIEWVLDPANAAAVAAMAARGRAVARGRFAPERYRARLLEVADAAVARWRG